MTGTEVIRGLHRLELPGICVGFKDQGSIIADKADGEVTIEYLTDRVRRAATFEPREGFRPCLRLTRRESDPCDQELRQPGRKSRADRRGR